MRPGTLFPGRSALAAATEQARRHAEQQPVNVHRRLGRAAVRAGRLDADRTATVPVYEQLRRVLEQRGLTEAVFGRDGSTDAGAPG